jgi:DNA-binding NarL/FixJ family response regulator
MNPSSPLPVQVFIVAPPLTGWGLRQLVEQSYPALAFAGSCSSLGDAHEQLEDAAADVVLADVDDAADIPHLAALAAEPERNVLLLTAAHDEAVLDAAVLAGVRGVLHKTDSPEVLAQAIAQVHAGHLWIDRAAAGRLFMGMARRRSPAADPEQPRIASLTLRERQTLAAVTRDASASAKVIASRLCISPFTLRNHLTSIYSKLGVVNRLDLYAYASRHSLQDAIACETPARNWRASSGASRAA